MDEAASSQPRSSAPVPGRFCIFCGRPPRDKNKEHVLPQWLLRLTGDPNRVVGFGTNWKTRTQLRFAFDQFQFPACDSCNGRYSDLEQRVHGYVEILLVAGALLARQWEELLDWLDKVRLGMWLGYRYLHRNYMEILPSFTIDARLGAKDRMVALYHFPTSGAGLNTFASETPLFQLRPCVFGLRINQLLFINASWDFMCSSRCGFPTPESYCHDIDTGVLEASALRVKGRVSHPVLPGLHKPVVMLFQPILHAGADGTVIGQPEDAESYTARHLWNGERRGCLFRQFQDGTVPICQRGDPVPFDRVVGPDIATMRQIVASIYLLQGNTTATERFRSADPARLRTFKSNLRSARRMNRVLADDILKGLADVPTKSK
jgi:hypothetical protein